MTAPQPVTVLTSTVLAVLMRVAGPVPTEVHPYALGYPEQQVSARIGDVVVYLTEPGAAARIRQQWDAAQYLATQRLPERVSQTWLGPRPGTYPAGVALRLNGLVVPVVPVVPAVEIRLHTTVLYNSTYHVDDEILVDPYVCSTAA